MQPPSVTVNKGYSIFVVCLAILLIILGSVVTSRYGAGVASDSVNYLAVAQNLFDGKGLIDQLGAPLILCPPLYPILLAGLKFITLYAAKSLPSQCAQETRAVSEKAGARSFAAKTRRKMLR